MVSYICPHFDSVDLYEQVDAIFQKLLTCGITVCGFDTETTVPNALKKTHNKSQLEYTNILQICINKNHGGTILEGISENEEYNYTCYIIHIKSLFIKYKTFPTSMIKFLRSKSIIKVGADITIDRKKLKKYIVNTKPLKMRGCIDLQDIARSIGFNNYSLDNLSMRYLGIGKSKSGLGNYEEELTTDQLYYACRDSYLSLSVYIKMTNLPTHPEKVKSTDTEEIVKNEKLPTNEIYDFLISSAVLNNAVPFVKIYNVVSNSYKPWHYCNNEKKNDLLKECLDDLIKSNHIGIIEDKYFLIKSKDDVYIKNEILRLMKKCIPVTGIKSSSLINFLDNSMNAIITNKENRIKDINSILISLIKDGTLIYNNNKLYLL